MTTAAIINLLYHHVSPDYVVLSKGVPASTGSHIQALLVRAAT